MSEFYKDFMAEYILALRDRMASAMVKKCCISQAVEMSVSPAMQRSLLTDTRPVSVAKNPILSAIMEARPIWYSSPIVWVNKVPYQIKLVKDTQQYSLLIQTTLRLMTDRNGMNFFRPLVKRTVVIQY